MQKIFTAFVEHKDFSRSRPWSVVRQQYDTSVISTPHYAETVELLLYDRVNGSAHIGGHRFELSGKQVFYVAPKTVHSFEYLPSDGYGLVVKLHPAMLKEFIDKRNVLGEYGTSFSQLNISYENYDDFRKHADILMSDDDISSALSSILSILRLLVSGSSEQNKAGFYIENSTANTVINDIIAWTEQNYSRKISLDEVANRFGYTKNYFCDMFRTKTGTTYMHYLNNVRISSACTLLKTGIPVKSVSQLCGFVTDSYFIKLFKKTIGLTPKQYRLDMGEKENASVKYL